MSDLKITPEEARKINASASELERQLVERRRAIAAAPKMRNYGPPVREEAIIRYAVRCDRATATLIDKAAARAGLSVTAFVQKHFETILDQPAAAPAPFDDQAFAPASFAARNGVTIFDARVWARLRAAADQAAIARCKIASIAGDLDVEEKAARAAVARLVEADIVRQLTAAGPGGATFHLRVMG